MGNTKNKKVVIVSGIILVALIAVFAIVYTQFIEKPFEGAKEVTVQIIHADKTSKEVKINTDKEYLRGALEQKELIAGAESEFGLFVLTVDDETVKEDNQEWWCFTKGGEQMMTSVDTTVIEDGDVFEITFTVGW